MKETTYKECFALTGCQFKMVIRNHLRTRFVNFPTSKPWEVLMHHRDQSLWVSLIQGMNFDYDHKDTFFWMLEQDDCDLALATFIYKTMLGPIWCGPEEGTRGMPEWARQVVLALVERESRKPFVSYGYADLDTVDRDKLLNEFIAASQKLEASQVASISVPTRLLVARPTGETNFKEYYSDETGLLFVPYDDPTRKEIRGLGH